MCDACSADKPGGLGSSSTSPGVNRSEAHKGYIVLNGTYTQLMYELLLFRREHQTQGSGNTPLIPATCKTIPNVPVIRFAIWSGVRIPGVSTFIVVRSTAN